MLNNYVDKVFLINLPHRSDRLQQFDSFAKELKIDYELVEAFDGKKLIDDNFSYMGKKVGQPYHSLNYFKGQVGCLLSHLNVLKICKKNNYKKVMIFEDDCGFVENFNHKFKKMIETVPSDWDMIYLSGSVPNFTENFDLYSKVSSILTTHSYLVNSSVFDLLIDNFVEKVFSKEVDMCYSDVQSIIKTYVSMPYLTYQCAGFSDIGGQHMDYNSTRQYL